MFRTVATTTDNFSILKNEEGEVTNLRLIQLHTNEISLKVAREKKKNVIHSN